MLNLRFPKKPIFSVFLLVLTASLGAESFRVSKVNSVILTENLDCEVSLKAGINEAIKISLPEDKTFLNGIEIKMDIPEIIASWMDSVACSIYSEVKPEPSSSQIDYTATRDFVSTLPGRLSWVLQIPLKPDNNFKTNKYTTKMGKIPKPSKNFLFLRLQPIMKGMSEEAINATIQITIKPVFSDNGQIELNLKSPDKTMSPCMIYIDNELTDLSANNKNLMLEKGIHDISIISEAYRNEVRTVRIDQAKTTVLDVELRSIAPTLVISAPASAIVYLDGQKCNTFDKEFEITQGSHTLRVNMGNYEIARTINAINGKTYNANFVVDLLVDELD